MSTLEQRIEAAQAYAGLTQEQLAERLELSGKTVRRAKRGHRPIYRRELLAIAEATGVPVWFLEVGFHPAAVQAGEEAVERLQGGIRADGLRAAEQVADDLADSEPHPDVRRSREAN